MSDHKKQVSSVDILKNLCAFLEAKDSFDSLPITTINSYLTEEGIDTLSASSRIMKKIEKIKAKALIAKASHKRKELENRGPSKVIQFDLAHIRDLVTEKLNELSQRNKLVMAHRDLNTISDDDLLSLAQDLDLLDDKK